MKRLFQTILLLLFITHLRAQTVQELTEQKQTQFKYLLEQIAALQTHIGTIQKGYNLAKNGLQTIAQIKKGDFNLHEGYFASLATVNPSMKQYSKTAAVIALQIGILHQYQQTKKSISAGGAINTDEANYIHKVFTSLMNESLALVDQLISLTTNGSVLLKDDERIKRIDALYGAMQDQYAFAQSFGRSVQLLALQRTKERSDAATLQFLYGLR